MNTKSRNTPRLGRRLWILGALGTVSALAALSTLACVKTRAPSVATNTSAPAFSLADSTGKQVSLTDLTAHGPAIVVFYRGYW